MISLYEAKITDFTQADYTKQYSLLECAMKEKVDSKRHVRSKMQTLAGYILLYKAMDELYHKKQFKITYNENGKPLCDFCFFNISHSCERVICVVSDEPIGVDIQKITNIKPRNKYKFFNELECCYVNQCEKLVTQRFVEIFTKKEAAVKMIGLSIDKADTIDTFSSEFCFSLTKSDDYLICICTRNI